MRKQIVSILLLISVLTPSFVLWTPSVQAATGGGAIGQAGGCGNAGTPSAWLDASISDGMFILNNGLKVFAKKFLKDFISGFIGGLLGNNVPTQDKASGDAAQTLTAAFINKYYRDDVIARCLSRQIINNITNNTSTIIQTRGRDGGSAFIKNWTNFQTQSQYRGENIFRAELSTAKLCGYLNDDIKKSYGVDPKKKTALTGQNTRTDSLQPFSLLAGCTMPAGFTPEKYQQDFAGNGGWDAYARMLEPQNNAWGLAALSQNEIAKQRTLQQTADTNQALAGKGYIGISGNGKNDSCKLKGPTGDCLIYKDITTTGDYLSNSTAAAIGAEYNWLTSAQGLGSVIEDVTGSMINRLFNQSDTSGSTLIKSPTAPTTIPVPTTDPTGSIPIPPPPAPVSLLVDVQAERTKYGVPMTPEEIGKLLNAVAWKNKDTGWVLLGKSGGNNCPAPGGALISCDFLVYAPTLSGYDVIGAQEEEGTPTWIGPDPWIPGFVQDGSRTLVPPIQP